MLASLSAFRPSCRAEKSSVRRYGRGILRAMDIRFPSPDADYRPAIAVWRALQVILGSTYLYKFK